MSYERLTKLAVATERDIARSETTEEVAIPHHCLIVIRGSSF